MVRDWREERQSAPARTCGEVFRLRGPLSLFDRVDIAALRWTAITVDGDQATAHANVGNGTRLIRTDGRWRIDAPHE